MKMDDHEAGQDDLLEQAIAAMREEASRSDLPQRTLPDTLAALRKAADSPGIFKRVINMTLTQKIAATVGLTLAGMTIYFCFVLFNGFSTVTYGQVADRIRAAKSMTVKITAQAPNLPNPMTMQLMWMEPNQTRIAMNPEVSMVMDQAKHRSLVLDAKAKTATITEYNMAVTPSQPSGGDSDFIGAFKKLANAHGEPAGEEMIGTVRATKFKAQTDGMDATVYVNAKTGALLRVDYDNLLGVSHLTMSDFDFDAKLDPGLFSFIPPPGYAVTNSTMQINGDLAENIVPLLRAYAQRNDGNFPPKIEDAPAVMRGIMKTKHPTTLPADFKPLMTNFGVAYGQLVQYQKGKTFGYQPQDVKLGDADKILLWYQPKDSKTYKAIYGDLHVAEVTGDKLPAAPAP